MAIPIVADSVAHAAADIAFLLRNLPSVRISFEGCPLLCPLTLPVAGQIQLPRR